MDKTYLILAKMQNYSGLDTDLVTLALHTYSFRKTPKLYGYRLKPQGHFHSLAAAKNFIETAKPISSNKFKQAILEIDIDGAINFLHVPQLDNQKIIWQQIVPSPYAYKQKDWLSIQNTYKKVIAQSNSQPIMACL